MNLTHLVVFSFFDGASSEVTPDVAGGIPQVGDNRFWKKGKRPFPRYWWQKDPKNIPDDIPLVDGLEELEKEEKELTLYLDEINDDGRADEIIRILRAYSEILNEQLQMRHASEEMQRITAVKKAKRRKKIILLLS